MLIVELCSQSNKVFLSLLARLEMLTNVGMIKYNYSGPGMTDGLRGQGSFLTRSLSTIPQITHLHIHLKDDTQTAETAQRVLEPYMELNNVRQVTCSGDISTSFVTALKDRLKSASQPEEQTSTREPVNFYTLPVELREQIFEYVLPSSGSERDELFQRSPREQRHILSLLLVSKQVYAHFRPFIFRNVTFIFYLSSLGIYSFRPDWNPVQFRIPSQFEPVAFPAGVPLDMLRNNSRTLEVRFAMLTETRERTNEVSVLPRTDKKLTAPKTTEEKEAMLAMFQQLNATLENAENLRSLKVVNTDHGGIWGRWGHRSKCRRNECRRDRPGAMFEDRFLELLEPAVKMVKQRERQRLGNSVEETSEEEVTEEEMSEEEIIERALRREGVRSQSLVL